MKKFKGFKPFFDERTGKRKPETIEQAVNDSIKGLSRMVAKTSSGQKAHRIGTEKLIEAGFDPLDRLMEQLEEIERSIQAELTSNAPRASYVEKLQALKLRILETILPYKYGKAPITTIQEVDHREPISIVLTTDHSDDPSNPDSGENEG